MKARFEWELLLPAGPIEDRDGIHSYEVVRHHVRNAGHAVLVEFWHRHAETGGSNVTYIQYCLLFSNGGFIECGKFDVDALEFDQTMLDMIWNKLRSKKTFQVTVTATTTGGVRLKLSDFWIRALNGDTRVQRGLPSNGRGRRRHNGNGHAALSLAGWDM